MAIASSFQVALRGFLANPIGRLDLCGLGLSGPLSGEGAVGRQRAKLLVTVKGSFERGEAVAPVSCNRADYPFIVVRMAGLDAVKSARSSWYIEAVTSLEQIPVIFK